MRCHVYKFLLTNIYEMKKISFIQRSIKSSYVKSAVDTVHSSISYMFLRKHTKKVQQEIVQLTKSKFAEQVELPNKWDLFYFPYSSNLYLLLMPNVILK